MPSYGFSTSLGFVSPTDADLLQTYIDYWFAETGILIDGAQASPDLDAAKTTARILKDAWDDVAATYGSAFVSSSEGASLRNLLYPFIGPPLPDSFSEVVLPLAGVALTNVPAGSAVRLGSDGPGATTWVLQTPVVIPGNGTFRYSVAGPKTALSPSIWTIATPVAGWVTVGPNPADAVLGRLAETDNEYRLRFVSAIVGGIIGQAIGAVPGVTSVMLFENPTDIPDSFWGATHWLEALVQGGDDTAIALAIQDSRTYTVNLLGTTTVVVPDPLTPTGTKDISFSRPNEIDVWVDINIIKGEGYSSDTSPAAITARENAIKAQIVTWSLTRQVGEDVTAFQVAAQALFTPGVPGIANVNPAKVGTSFPAGDAEVVAEVRDLLVFDVARITVTGA